MPVNVSSLSPTSAFYAGGTSLTVYGSNFVDTQQIIVSFAPTKVGGPLQVSGTFISATQVSSYSL